MEHPTWTQSRYTNIHRAGHCLVTARDRLYSVGGFSGQQSNLPGHLRVNILNEVHLSWKLLPTSGDIPAERRHHSAVVYQNRIYVWGGYIKDGNPPPAIHELDLGE